jgi:hypothetical protein
MRRSAHIASLSLVALLLATGLANAGGPFGGGGSPQVSINDSVSDAVKHDTSGDIKDGVFDAVKPLNSQDVNSMLVAKDGLDLGVGAGALAIDCDVGGADLLVANVGDVTIPAGARLKWTVPAEHARGQVKLLRDLTAGTTVRIADALDGSADADTQCSAQPIGL